jgi:hypothetical protein
MMVTCALSLIAPGGRLGVASGVYRALRPARHPLNSRPLRVCGSDIGRKLENKGESRNLSHVSESLENF